MEWIMKEKKNLCFFVLLNRVLKTQIIIYDYMQGTKTNLRWIFFLHYNQLYIHETICVSVSWSLMIKKKTGGKQQIMNHKSSEKKYFFIKIFPDSNLKENEKKFFIVCNEMKFVFNKGIQFTGTLYRIDNLQTVILFESKLNE